MIGPIQRSLNFAQHGIDPTCGLDFGCGSAIVGAYQCLHTALAFGGPECTEPVVTYFRVGIKMQGELVTQRVLAESNERFHHRHFASVPGVSSVLSKARSLL